MTQPKTASKHTPGPWEAKQAGPNLWIYADDIAVAFIGGKDTPFTLQPNVPHEANASLIAQAPEMYELLKHMSIHKHLCKYCPDKARRIKVEIDGE